VNRFALLIATAIAAAACASQPAPQPVAAKKVEDVPVCQATPKELVIKDLKVGEGPRALIPRASLLVHYTGWVYDGCKADFKGVMFDSSSGRPAPFGFVLGAGRVIKGWDEGLVGMKEKGGKRLLIIPPDKAYGEAGRGDKIPPNAALVFEIDIVQIAYYPPATP
jgi:FKBP-type peptidyl-prolyl cis-trans isomerase FkpA